jgi:hypothetical protein
MDATILDRAQLEFDRANQSIIDLGATNHVGEIERHWAAFLVNFARAYTRLEAAAGKGSAWWAKIAHERKTEPLLRYLQHARNVDEHGFKLVIERQPGFIREVGSTPVDPVRPGAGMISTLEIQNPHVKLVDVIDRGVHYAVPTSFRGMAISPHPLNVGLLGLSCLETVMVDARGQLDRP